MSSRDLILARVRASQPAPPPLPQVPTFERELASPIDAFARALERMGGVVAEPPPGISLDTFIFERFPQALVICSATPEVRGTQSIASVHAPAALENVDVAVVRAAFGVAETGSVWLSEKEFGLNALGAQGIRSLTVIPSPVTRNTP